MLTDCLNIRAVNTHYKKDVVIRLESSLKPALACYLTGESLICATVNLGSRAPVPWFFSNNFKM